jgi:hypothetical protein
MLHAKSHLKPRPLGGRSHATVALHSPLDVALDLAVAAMQLPPPRTPLRRCAPTFRRCLQHLSSLPAACDAFNRSSCCPQTPPQVQHLSPARQWWWHSPSPERSDCSPVSAIRAGERTASAFAIFKQRAQRSRSSAGPSALARASTSAPLPVAVNTPRAACASI